MKKTNSVLVIDDEPDIRELLEITLGRMGLNTVSAANCKEAKEYLAKQEFDLCLTDLKLPDGSGIDLVNAVQQLNYPLPVAVFTAHGNTDAAITAMKAGAYDFISKPVNLEQLRQLINNAVSSKSQSPPEGAANQLAFVGESQEIVKLKQQIKKLARSQAPIYISGESGSGKELVARAIHYQGPRAEGPFIAVNCGAIPSELVESEFFGHTKGSFTGAHQDKLGLFQAANGGTLFLDEVADLPLDMQVKLLRALQEKAVRPVGGQGEIHIDVRILSATHKNLQTEIDKQRFRSDLFYRINVIEVSVPPLRQRYQDIPILCNYFLEKIATESNSAEAIISAKALKRLQGYNFPGNVRELENILERAFTLCENNLIDELDLSINEQSAQTLSTTNNKHNLNGQSLDDYLMEIEKDILLNALELSRWNKTAAAESLGISFRSFRYRLKKLSLDEE